MCIHPDCKKHPVYNNEGEKKALYWVDPINNTNKTIEIIQLFYNE